MVTAGNRSNCFFPSRAVVDTDPRRAFGGATKSNFSVDDPVINASLNSISQHYPEC
jgi:hypothetical protein